MKTKKYLLLVIKILSVILTAGILFGLSILIVSAGMVASTEDRIYSHDSIQDIDKGYDYILVLGAGLKRDGSLTDMLRDRTLVSIDLYKAGVADTIIMSGDRSGDDYDEPSAMKKFAIEHGVPEESIICDYEGYSTHESIDRFEEAYSSASVVIVTQKYHLHRALYIAKEQGVKSYIGVDADLDTYGKQIIYDFREIFARYKDFMFLE